MTRSRRLIFFGSAHVAADELDLIVRSTTGNSADRLQAVSTRLRDQLRITRTRAHRQHRKQRGRHMGRNPAMAASRANGAGTVVTTTHATHAPRAAWRRYTIVASCAPTDGYGYLCAVPDLVELLSWPVLLHRSHGSVQITGPASVQARVLSWTLPPQPPIGTLVCERAGTRRYQRRNETDHSGRCWRQLGASGRPVGPLVSWVDILLANHGILRVLPSTSERQQALIRRVPGRRLRSRSRYSRAGEAHGEAGPVDCR